MQKLRDKRSETESLWKETGSKVVVVIQEADEVENEIFLRKLDIRRLRFYYHTETEKVWNQDLFPSRYQRTRSPGAPSSPPCRNGFYCRSRRLFPRLSLKPWSAFGLIALSRPLAVSPPPASALVCSRVQIGRFCSATAVCHNRDHLLCDTRNRAAALPPR